MKGMMESYKSKCCNTGVKGGYFSPICTLPHLFCKACKRSLELDEVREAGSRFEDATCDMPSYV